MHKLSGQTALITGAGRGIGRALAQKLASEGADLVLNDLDLEPLEEVATEIREGGGRVATVAGSVSEDGFAERFIAAALESSGRLDIIVNNAGYTWLGTAATTTDEQMEAMFRLHMLAPHRILRAAYEPIREMNARETAEGREVFRKVVNVSSMAGTGGVAGQFAYSSAKAGLIGSTRTLAKEWGRMKVNVNCVAYGLIDTRLNQVRDEADTSVEIEGHTIALGLSRKFKDVTERLIPIGRMGTAKEAADGAYLMCIPEANYISGQVLIVGGGLAN